jgi:hypothetical protein
VQETEFEGDQLVYLAEEGFKAAKLPGINIDINYLFQLDLQCEVGAKKIAGRFENFTTW